MKINWTNISYNSHPEALEIIKAQTNILYNHYKLDNYCVDLVYNENPEVFQFLKKEYQIFYCNWSVISRNPYYI